MRRCIIRGQHADGGLAAGVQIRRQGTFADGDADTDACLGKIISLYNIVDRGADKPDVNNNAQAVAGKAEAGQVIIKPEWFALVGADGFIEAVAEKEAVIEDGYFRFFTRN